MTMLADQVDVVIGVDTHQDTHTAAVVSAATGGVLAEVTVAATAEGYDQLVVFAERHDGLRVWAIEGTARLALIGVLVAKGGRVVEPPLRCRTPVVR